MWFIFGNIPLEKIFRIGLIFAAGLVGRRLLNLFTKRLIEEIEERKQVETLIGVISSVGNVIIWSVVLITALAELGVNVTPLITGAGLVGFGISFGAQTLIRDFLSGFFILLENQFNVGDKITVAGKTGTVKEMRVRSTILQGENGESYIIPNSKIDVVVKHG